MIATDFSRAKAVCAARYANFAADCCKSVVSAPHLGAFGKGEQAPPRAMTLGSRKGLVVQIRATMVRLRARPLKWRPGRVPGPALSYDGWSEIGFLDVYSPGGPVTSFRSSPAR